MTITVVEHEASRMGTRAFKIKKRKPTSVVGKIYESLLGEIITGVVPPGCYLSESSLADRFKASRTPVREVLIHLYKEGFVQKGPSKGFVVSHLSLESIRELFFLRLLLEPADAKLAARNPALTQPCVELEQVPIRMQHLLAGCRIEPFEHGGVSHPRKLNELFTAREPDLFAGVSAIDNRRRSGA